MKRSNVVVTLIAVLLLTSCGPASSQTELSTLTAPSAETSKPDVTSTALPRSAPDLGHVGSSAMLFEQNFETGTADGISFSSGEWTISQDETGNHVFCNTFSSVYSVVSFGKDWWSNYSVEMRVKSIVQNQDPYVGIYSRTSSTENYQGTLNFNSNMADLSGPNESLAQTYVQTNINTWYLLRMEVYGDHIKYYIDNRLVGDAISTQRSQGRAGFSASPLLRACFDDIRAWALTATGSVGPAPIIPISLEVVTANADTINNWGGYQTRIVRTLDGVFTTYLTSGSDVLNLEWNLARRGDNGVWEVIARGNAGDGPVSLLASQDGTLYILGRPGGIYTVWSGKPGTDFLDMTPYVIPGEFGGYPAAGIDKRGDICVFSSDGDQGGGVPGGKFLWACLLESQGMWISHVSTLDYRYCYTYVIPGPDNQLSVVSNIDVLWSVLGYAKPAGEFAYITNAIGYWRTDDIINNPMERVFFKEEVPTEKYPLVHLGNSDQDAYLDTSGNMHIIYYLQGESTQGAYTHRQVVLSPEGKILEDISLPDDLGGFVRIFQDARGEFYILGSDGELYPAGMDGVTLGTPYVFDLKGYTVEYSGIYIAAPRGGTMIKDVVDVGFVTGNGTKWIYFQLKLPRQ